MNAKKHTPGPWLRDDCSGLDCDVRAASGRKVALCWGLASNNATNYRADYRAECDANAHLIAAAPELLEALSKLLNEVDGLIGESAGVVGLHLNGDIAPWSDLEEGGRFERLSSMSKARAAIAKATGDAQ